MIIDDSYQYHMRLNTNYHALSFFFFFNQFYLQDDHITLLTALITLTLYLLLTLLILILTQIMHTLHYDTCITILLTLI